MKYLVQPDLLLCPTRAVRSPLSTDPQIRRSIARLVLRSPSRYHSYQLAARDRPSNPGQEEHRPGQLNCAGSDVN